MDTLKIPTEISYTLREIPFFQNMPAELIAQIEEFVDHRNYQPRQKIYYPDEPCDRVFWLRKGRVKVTRVSTDGRQMTFRHLFAGDILGEECLVNRNRRDDHAEAREYTILSCMRTEIFRKFAREEPSFATALAASMCHRITESEQVLADTVFNSVRHRVAAGILRLHKRESVHHGNTLRVTHQEIAALAGSTRETTTSVLQKLRAEGILKMANRRLTVLDTEALAHIATGKE